MFGDTIANFSLSTAIEEHLRRKKEDKMNIMTKVFKKLPLDSPLRTGYDDAMLVIDSSNKQILQYQNTSEDKQIELFLERISFKKQRNNLQIRYDLYDTEITICSHEIFQLMIDHFDYNV